MQIVSLVVAGAALLMAGACFILLRRLSGRFNTAMVGSGEDTLEHKLTDHAKNMRQLDTNFQQIVDEQARLAASLNLASQKISIVRFNPFGATGGDQSFRLAVLDAESSGYILTSIHGRGGTRVYVKPIDFGKSKYPLSSEEQQALERATKRVPTGSHHGS